MAVPAGSSRVRPCILAPTRGTYPAGYSSTEAASSCVLVSLVSAHGRRKLIPTDDATMLLEESPRVELARHAC